MAFDADGMRAVPGPTFSSSSCYSWSRLNDTETVSRVGRRRPRLVVAQSHVARSCASLDRVGQAPVLTPYCGWGAQGRRCLVPTSR